GLEQRAAGRDAGLVVLEVRGREEVLDEPEQALALTLHPFEELGAHLRIVGELGLAERLRVAEQRGDRRPKLVRDDGDELTLHAVELPELVDRVVLLLEQRLELAG